MFRTPKFDTIARDLEDTLRITKEYQSLNKDGLPESPVITKQRKALQRKIDLLQKKVDGLHNRLIRLSLDALGLNHLTVEKYLDLMTDLRDDFKKLRKELYDEQRKEFDDSPISPAYSSNFGLRMFTLWVTKDIREIFPEFTCFPSRNKTKDNLTKFVNLLEWCKGGEIDKSFFSPKEIAEMNNLSDGDKDKLRKKLEGRHVEAMLKINYTHGNCAENIEEILNVMENDIARLRYELSRFYVELFSPLLLMAGILFLSTPNNYHRVITVSTTIYFLVRILTRLLSNKKAKLLRTRSYIDV